MIKNIFAIGFVISLTGCVVNPYYDSYYSERVDVQYTPSGSTLIYRETINRPQVIYVQPHHYHRDGYNRYYRQLHPKQPYNNRYDRGHHQNRDHWRR